MNIMCLFFIGSASCRLPGYATPGLDIVCLFTSGADLQEFLGLFQIRPLEKKFELLSGHDVGLARGTEHGKFRVPVIEQAVTKCHHKALKVDTRRAVKGAFTAGEAIPQGLAFRAFRIQGELFDDPPGGSVIGIFPVEIQHGTDRRAFAALQTIVKIVFLYELFNLYL